MIPIYHFYITLLLILLLLCTNYQLTYYLLLKKKKKKIILTIINIFFFLRNDYNDAKKISRMNALGFNGLVAASKAEKKEIQDQR